MKRKQQECPPLIENTKLADDDCAWCGAFKGQDVHTRACPYGERYKQVQQLGESGIALPTDRVCIQCGQEFLTLCRC